MYETKKFKRLKDAWYKKLKTKGFADIEDKKGNLLHDTHPRTISSALKVKASREIYYSIARDFLNVHKFKGELDRKIWEMHCEGIGRTTIARDLNITRYKAEKVIVTLSCLAKLRKNK